MTDTIIEPEVVEPDVGPPETERATPKDHLIHTTCCEDESVAMCGGRLTGKVIVNPDPAARCGVCADLWDLDNYCPKGGLGTCTWDEATGGNR